MRQTLQTKSSALVPIQYILEILKELNNLNVSGNFQKITLILATSSIQILLLPHAEQRGTLQGIQPCFQPGFRQQNLTHNESQTVF